MSFVPVIVAWCLSTGALEAPTQTPVWLNELPATLSQVTEASAIEVHGCRISIGTALEIPPFPPVFHVWVHKEGCETGGYALLGTSYSAPATLLDARKQAIVATFTFRLTPSGSAFEQAQLVSLDFDTGERTHASTLAALPPFGSGRIEPTALELRGSGTVVIRGTKNGVIPGEVGEGDEFIALFDKFVRDPSFDPAPSRVTAF